jgi:hypothetical protein
MLTRTFSSSRQALKKYVQNNNPIPVTSQTQFDAQFNRALRAGVEKGEFVQPKGMCFFPMVNVSMDHLD